VFLWPTACLSPLPWNLLKVHRWLLWVRSVRWIECFLPDCRWSASGKSFSQVTE
jgi:hypothetical protein